jgi:beta-1,4-mannosyl-glycoprotein beta-1,4-N-acetylglucosaminyltransferase
MIYDCFTFFNELELLELRLHELAGVVDRFVLVEATQTYSNKPKPLYYQENRSRFDGFRDKIIHVVVDDLPVSTDPWVLENFQRNCIGRGLTGCRPEDFVLVSDLDEIPRASVVERMSREIPFHDDVFSNALHAGLNSGLVKNVFHRKGFRRRLRRNHPFVWKFRQLLHPYYLNNRPVPPMYTHGTRMMRFRDFSCAEEMRHSGYKIIPDAGWHFTWMGGVERIQQKITAYSHQENNQPQFLDPQNIQRALNEGHSLFNDGHKMEFVPLDDSFPRYVIEHPEKFSHWIRPVER